MSKVTFSYAEGQKLYYPNRTALKQFIEQLFKLEKRKLDTLVYVFCSDEFLLSINNTHLQHDYYTDIITFDLSESTNAVVGEIYISVDRVRENAISNGIAFKNELERVVFHGALHLCGYKDKLKKDIVLMRAKEDYYLNHFK